MKPARTGSIQRGQAAVEAVLVVALLVLFMHGVATVGSLQMQGLGAAQFSRHAVFLSARGMATPAFEHGALVSIDASPFVDASGTAGNPDAVGLARDWLRADPHLRTAFASVQAPGQVPFTQSGSAARIMSIQRHTTLAVSAGHAHGQAATVQRLGMSPAGWTATAQRSQAAAQALHRRMQPVDAPWARGQWSVDWLGAWMDIGPGSRGMEGR
ncbi:hypothetical protein [Bordetella petrii]|uniref:hypothetical protein n=1 Tax=Bordetella petrii TaxID=94624 RepID=UPI001E379DE5|nr:hypothetical protein [Bordetella petrii]MCD0501636.1 hypothetical protein [Bordetella petrii]